MNVLELFEWAEENDVSVSIRSKQSKSTEVTLSRKKDGVGHGVIVRFAHTYVQHARFDVIEKELAQGLMSLNKYMKSEDKCKHPDAYFVAAVGGEYCPNCGWNEDITN